PWWPRDTALCVRERATPSLAYVNSSSYSQPAAKINSTLSTLMQSHTHKRTTYAHKHTLALTTVCTEIHTEMHKLTHTYTQTCTMHTHAHTHTHAPCTHTPT